MLFDASKDGMVTSNRLERDLGRRAKGAAYANMTLRHATSIGHEKSGSLWQWQWQQAEQVGRRQ